MDEKREERRRERGQSLDCDSFCIIAAWIENVLNAWSPGGSAVLESDGNFEGSSRRK